MVYSPVINTYHDSNFIVTVSNIPGMSFENIYLIDNFFRGIDIPGYNLTAYQEYINGEEIVIHPLQHRNEGIGEFTLTLKLSENLLNYLYIMRYMQALKYGQKDPEIPGNEIVSDKINKVKIEFLDNQMRPIAYYSFNGCLPTQISNINLNYGSNNELAFSVTMKCESVDIDIVDLPIL